MKKLALFALALFQIAMLLAQMADNQLFLGQGTKEDILMQTATITTCFANFYDSGSSEGE